MWVSLTSEVLLSLINTASLRLAGVTVVVLWRVAVDGWVLDVERKPIKEEDCDGEGKDAP